MRTHVVLHRRIATCEPFLGAKTLKVPLHRMALLLRALRIFKKPLIDLACEAVKLWATNILTALLERVSVFRIQGSDTGFDVFPCP